MVALETKATDAMFVFLSDLQLDIPQVLLNDLTLY